MNNVPWLRVCYQMHASAKGERDGRSLPGLTHFDPALDIYHHFGIYNPRRLSSNERWIGVRRRLQRAEYESSLRRHGGPSMDWEVSPNLDTSRLAFASLRESVRTPPSNAVCFRRRDQMPFPLLRASGDMRPTHDDGGSVGGKCQPITIYFGLLHLQP